MPDDNNEEDGSEDEEFSLGIGPTDEEMEEYLRTISFEWCQTVRKAGSVYRNNGSLSETTNELGTTTDKTREAVATYIHIHTYEGNSDVDITIIPGEEFGLRYFRDNEVSPGEIFEEVSWEIDSPEELREKIRIFVAHQTKNVDLGEINLNQDIPQTPNRTLPSTRATQTVQNVFSQTQDIGSQLNYLDFVTQIPAIQLNSLMVDLEETVQNIIEPLYRALQEIDFESIREQQRIKTALQNGIYRFDSPSSYDPSTATVDEETKSVGTAALENFISNVEQSGITDLNDYLTRLRYGLERYEQEDYTGSTLVFLSVQDGFLDFINQQTGNQPSGNYYTYSDRQDAFDNEFPEIFGIQSQDVASQWEDFLSHRHKIMHGDPDAHLDENIASVALIFLVLAMYTALELLNVD